MTLAEIRAGNTNYGPTSPVAETQSWSFQQPPQPPKNGELSAEAGKERNSALMSQLSDYKSNDSGLIKPETSQDAFVESLNEFEAQRNAMMSPICTINSCKDSRLDIYPSQTQTQLTHESSRSDSQTRSDFGKPGLTFSDSKTSD